MSLSVEGAWSNNYLCDCLALCIEGCGGCDRYNLRHIRFVYLIFNPIILQKNYKHIPVDPDLSLTRLLPSEQELRSPVTPAICRCYSFSLQT
ncbi:MAG TPA: hypothetical protein V6D50_20240 [Chroococcales cyanobacterium]